MDRLEVKHSKRKIVNSDENLHDDITVGKKIVIVKTTQNAMKLIKQPWKSIIVDY